MAKAQTPSVMASSAKVIVDAVQTTFGAAVVVLFFFGVALISLASGLCNLGPDLRGEIIRLLIWLMVGLVVVLILLRMIKPAGLGGPPPETEHVQITNSKST